MQTLSLNIFHQQKKVSLCTSNCRSIEVSVIYPRDPDPPSPRNPTETPEFENTSLRLSETGFPETQNSDENMAPADDQEPAPAAVDVDLSLTKPSRASLSLSPTTPPPPFRFLYLPLELRL